MVGVRTANQLEDLRELIRSHGMNQLCLGVAYVTENGLKEILPDLENCIEDKSIKFLVYLDGTVTHPKAISRLVGLSANTNFEVRAWVPRQNNAIFHSKFYISYSEDSVALLAGSHNLTESALGKNVEFGLRVETKTRCNKACTGIDGHVGCQAIREFEKLWGNTKPLNHESVSLYERFYRQERVRINKGHDKARSALYSHLRELGAQETFSWPSKDSARFMGLLCAGGTLQNSEKGDRTIRITPRLKPGAYKNREVVALGKSYEIDHIFSSIRQELRRSVPLSLRDAPITDTGELGIEIDCTRANTAFDKIVRAFGYSSVFSKKHVSIGVSSLPTGLLVKRPPKAIIREFVKGYAFASGMVSDNTGKRIWLNTPEERIQQPILALFHVIDIEASAPKVCISVSAMNFRAVGFGDPRDEIVEAIAQTQSR